MSEDDTDEESYGPIEHLREALDALDAAKRNADPDLVHARLEAVAVCAREALTDLKTLETDLVVEALQYSEALIGVKDRLEDLEQAEDPDVAEQKP